MTSLPAVPRGRGEFPCAAKVATEAENANRESGIGKSQGGACCMAVSMVRKGFACRWCFRAKRTQRHHRLYRVALQRDEPSRTGIGRAKTTQKGQKNVPFWVLDGFAKLSASALEGMAGTTGLEPAASAVTGHKLDVTI